MYTAIIPLWAQITLLAFAAAFALFYIYKTYTFKKHHGAYFLPTKDAQIDTIVQFIKEHPNKSYIDLGSGTGKIVKQLLDRNIKAYGIEINPLLVLVSKLRLGKNHSKIRKQDFWEYDFSQHEGVITYALSEVMDTLYKKLVTEMKPGALVISVRFPIKKLGQKLALQKNNVFFYQL